MPKDRNDNDEKLVHQLSEAIEGLTRAIHCGVEWAKHQNENQTILYRIERKIDQIMASQAEVAADLRTANAQLRKLIADTAGVQPAVDALLAKIVELEALVVAGAAVSQELIDAVAETKTLAQAVDDNVPELPTPPPPTP